MVVNETLPAETETFENLAETRPRPRQRRCISETRPRRDGTLSDNIYIDDGSIVQNVLHVYQMFYGWLYLLALYTIFFSAFKLHNKTNNILLLNEIWACGYCTVS
jgi:hypothetical protein